MFFGPSSPSTRRQGRGERRPSPSDGRSPAALDSIHETEPGKPHGADGGAVLEKEVGRLNRSGLCFHYVRPDLGPVLGALLDRRPLNWLLAGYLQVERQC